jgi:hypothetical protein
MLAALGAIYGCGGDKTAYIGDPAEKGTYLRSVDKAKDVAAQESAANRANDSLIYSSQ